MKESAARPTSLTVPLGLVITVGVSLAFILLYGALTQAVAMPSTYAHLTDSARQAQNQVILDYLRGPLFRPCTLEFLTENERAHMTDVKGVFDGFFLTYLTALGIIIGTVTIFAIKRMWRSFDELLGRALIIAGWSVVGLTALIAIGALADFSWFWTAFHGVFFPQGNWQFPNDSMLITLYPEIFFERVATRILSHAAVTGLIAVLLGVFLRRMRRAEAEFTAAMEEKPKKGKRR